MLRHEDERTEFKREWSESIRKTIIAFANTQGGTLWVGVDDEGRATGVEDPDGLALRIGNMVRDSIQPDLTLFVQCDRTEIEGKTVLRVDVQRGTDRPYFARAAGLRPEGVFVRQGASSVSASDTRIRDLLREDGAEPFESCRAFCQELTFESLSAAFQKRKIPFGAAQETTLGLRRPDGLYTNLAFLLSEQCRPTIKLAAFKGDAKETFRDRREPRGSLLAQLDEAFAFLCKWNDVRSEIRGFEREDFWDYDEEDIREALLNAVVHRDYSRQDATLASVFSDRIEIVSIGGIVPGYDPADLIDGGVSALRNHALAGVFAKLGYIEAFGTGIPKIRRSYAGIEPGPRFQFLPHAFRVVLPNKRVADSANVPSSREMPFARESSGTPYGGALRAVSAAMTRREDAIVSLLRKAGTLTREEVQKATGVSLATILRDLKSLLCAGRIAKIGSGRTTRYIPGPMPQSGRRLVSRPQTP